MLKLILNRVLAAIPVLIFVVTLAFLLVEIMPGDPAETLAGSSDVATLEDVERIREQLNLDRPLAERFFDYLGDVASADFGESLFSAQPVVDLLEQALPVTISLSLMAIVMGILLAVPAGMLAALRRDTFLDRFISSASAVSLAVPSFVLAFPLVIVVALNWGWFPPTGYESIADGGLWGWAEHLILPGFALSLGVAAELARQVRGAMVDTLEQDYIRTARAMGLNTRTVIWQRALKNSAIPVITVLGLQAGRILGGAVIVEAVFAMPGYGTLAYDAVVRQDIPVIQGVVITGGVVVLLANLLTDISYGILNPKLRD